MSAILEIAAKLQDTEAAIAALSRAAAQNPSEPSLMVTRASLLKRQRNLEEQFSHAAALNELDVCNYRTFKASDAENPPVFNLASALRDFQIWFTVVYDALKYGPKQ